VCPTRRHGFPNVPKTWVTLCGSKGQSRGCRVFFLKIDIAAAMCHVTQIHAMNVEIGLVTWKRDHVIRVIRGRKRSVRGKTQYTIYPAPDAKRAADARLAERAPKILSSEKAYKIVCSSTVNFSTVKGVESQVLPKPPIRPAVNSPGASSAVNSVEQQGADRSSSPRPKSAADDDSALPTGNGSKRKSRNMRMTRGAT